MALADGKIGAEGSYKISVKEGKIVVEGLYDTKGADFNVAIALDSDYFLDQLAAKIPGQIDDAVIQIFKGALKAIG